MPFTKDNPGKGRIKGSQNKVTKAIREMLKDTAEAGLGKFMTELFTLSGEKYVNAYLQLCRFIVPTLQSVKIDDVDKSARSITVKLKELREQSAPTNPPPSESPAKGE